QWELHEFHGVPRPSSAAASSDAEFWRQNRGAACWTADAVAPDAGELCLWFNELLDRVRACPASQPALFYRELHGLGSTAHAELAQDLRHAVTDGALGQPQARR